MNILDLKILQVFFKDRGEILVFEKMLNFLSFLVLLYVSGRFKQNGIFPASIDPRKNISAFVASMEKSRLSEIKFIAGAR